MNKINLSYLNELSGGDSDFVVEMLQTYLDETSKDMQALTEAQSREDVSRVGFLAHRCKAAFKMLGLDNLAGMAEKLEQDAKSGKFTASDLDSSVKNITAGAEQSFQQVRDMIKSL